MKKSLYLILSILVFSSVSTLQASPVITQDSNFSVIWVADTTIYADRFPVVIAAYESITSNITIETSYQNLSVIQELDYEAEIFWIGLPRSLQGNDNLTVYIDDESFGPYSFAWDRSGSFENSPISISYSYSEFSYWVGSSRISAKYGSDYFQVNYTTSYSELAKKKQAPYNNDFKILGEYEFDNILSRLDLSNTHKFQSWKYQGIVGICDGGGFSQNLVLEYEERTVEIEYLIDNDSCSGTRSIYSDPSIADLFESMNATTYEIVENNGALITPLDLNLHLYFPTIFTIIFLRKRRRN